MPPTTTRSKAKDVVAGLTADERRELLEELRAEQAAAAAPWSPGAQPRELTPRERAVRLLLRDRDHVDGCPLIEDEHRSAGRVEAFDVIRPANPARAEPAKTMTVVRCIECGGQNILADDWHTNLLRALNADEQAADDLDGAL